MTTPHRPIDIFSSASSAADNMRNRIIDAQNLEIATLKEYFENMDTNGLKNINKIKNIFTDLNNVKERLNYEGLTVKKREFFDKWFEDDDNLVKFKLSRVGRGKKHKKRILSKKNKLKRRPNSRKKKYSAKFIE